MLKGPLETKLTNPYQFQTLLGFTLREDSPASDAGVAIDSMPHIPRIKHDFYGTLIDTGNPEPGIYELGRK
jgi:hypothetical protein